ncbi:hypothetical protein NDU88_011380 [Pleurodeles waltl]|uniref:Uncharacterized protein n=1 Tax=Pleurodeles waltl TaxID=8319 RepID=A0AAV7PY98_PLEWA|nr:hypothetical protein NDU88_011380 [Pleurodeles waltl]
MGQHGSPQLWRSVHRSAPTCTTVYQRRSLQGCAHTAVSVWHSQPRAVGGHARPRLSPSPPHAAISTSPRRLPPAGSHQRPGLLLSHSHAAPPGCLMAPQALHRLSRYVRSAFCPQRSTPPASVSAGEVKPGHTMSSAPLQPGMRWQAPSLLLCSHYCFVSLVSALCSSVVSGKGFIHARVFVFWGGRLPGTFLHTFCSLSRIDGSLLTGFLADNESELEQH